MNAARGQVKVDVGKEARNKLQLDARIAPPDEAKYRHVRDAKDWLNPSLVIMPDGVILHTNLSPNRENKVTSVEKLAENLCALPVTSWTYGSVVAISETGLHSGLRKDDALIKRNKERIVSVLNSLSVKIDWWPSA